MEITTKIGCMVNCIYCPQSKLVREYRKRSETTLMRPDVFSACIEKLPPAIDMHFSGMCEPWVNPKCADMILYAHERGHRILVSTTLTGLTGADIEKIESIDFKHFNVHLPHRSKTADNASVERHIMILERLQNSSITPNYRCHGAFVSSEILSILGDKIHLSKPHTRAGNKNVEKNSPPARIQGPISCRRDLRQNVLLPNGDVVLCCMDYGLQHVLGNLLTCDYSNLLQSKELSRVRKGLTDESEEILCRYCEVHAQKKQQGITRVVSKLKTAMRNLQHHR